MERGSEPDVGASEFAVLGQEQFDRPASISRPPAWVAAAGRLCADVTDPCGRRALTDVHWLPAQLVELALRQGVVHLFPVQNALGPRLANDLRADRTGLRRRDVCVAAPTGSGKTLSYVLPILCRLLRDERRPFGAGGVFALVVAPSQELVHQVHRVLVAFGGQRLGARVLALDAGRPLAAERRLLWRSTATGWRCTGADVLVTNVSRLLEHLLHVPPAGRQHTPHSLDLRTLTLLVVDEADRLMCDYRVDWLAELHNAVHNYTPSTGGRLCVGTEAVGRVAVSGQRRAVQKVLLSATLGRDPELLQLWQLFRPIMLTADGDDSPATEHVQPPSAPQSGAQGTVAVLPTQLQQRLLVVEPRLKPLAVYVLLKTQPSFKRVLCFTDSREATNRLCRVLGALFQSDPETIVHGYNVVQSINSGMVLGHRRKVLRRFCAEVQGERRGRVLVCTDLVARGVDLPNVDLALSYDPPSNPLAYAHRAGRTARMGKPGCALTLVHDQQQAAGLRQMLSGGGLRTDDLQPMTLEENDINMHLDRYKSALKALAGHIKGANKRTAYRGRRRK